MDKKRDLVLKLSKDELGDLIMCIGTCLLFLTRYGLLSQRHRVMEVRDLVWNQVSGQLIVKPKREKETEGDEEDTGTCTLRYATVKG